MDLADKTKDEEVKEIYNLIESAEKEFNMKDNTKSIELLGKTIDMYKELSKKGKWYLSKNCSDIPKRINGLINRLEYNS